MPSNSSSNAASAFVTLVLSALALFKGAGWVLPSLDPTPTAAIDPMKSAPVHPDLQWARLWQDPNIVPTQAALMEIGPRAASRPREDAAPPHDIKSIDDTIDDIKRLWNETACKTEPTLVLAVYMNTSPFAEYSEIRLRTRYAVAAALATMGFGPASSERLGLLDVVLSPPNRSSNSAQPSEPLTDQSLSFGHTLSWRIPAELFNTTDKLRRGGKDRWHTPFQKVLVLWLDNDCLAREPALRLAALADAVLGSKTQEAAWPECWSFAVVGPEGSGSLVDLLRLPASSAAAPAGPPAKRQIPLFSPWATLDWEETHPFNTDPGKIRSPWITATDRMQIARCVTSDWQLVSLLQRELSARGVLPSSACAPQTGNERAACASPARPKPIPIVLISEWDTAYARGLTQSLKQALSSPTQGVASYRYERGLRGDPPPDSGAQAGSSSASNLSQSAASIPQAAAEMLSTARASDYPATGPRETDYLRRLVEAIRHDSGADSGISQVAAIGLIGADAPDKSLLLRALRGSFPNALFFTTDIDARLWQEHEYRWSHNLLIAAHDGIQVPKAFIEAVGEGHDVPPFRYSYQTSVFRACALALSGDNPSAELPPLPRGMELSPSIYEIGRSGIVRLPAIDSEGYPLARSTRGTREPHAASIPWRVWIGLILAGTIIALTCAFGWHTWHATESDGGPLFARHASTLHQRTSAAAEWPQLRRRLAWSVLLWIVICGSIAGLYALAHASAEPLYWTEGVSSWPGVALDAGACAVAVIGLWRLARYVRHESNLLRDAFHLESADFRLSDVPTIGWQAPRASPVRAQDLMSEYLKRARMRSRLIRVTMLTVICSACLLSLVQLLRVEHGSARGPLCRGACDVFEYLGGAAAIVVSITTWDSTRLLGRLICYLSTGDSDYLLLVDNVPTISILDERVADIDQRLRPRVLDILLIADLTGRAAVWIYTPFAVFLLLLVARLPLMDYWPIDYVRVSAMVVLGLVVCFSSWALNRAAVAARERELGQLRSLLRRQRAGIPVAASETAIESAIARIEGIEEGAFRSPWEQPLFRAVLLPFSGLGVAQLLQIVT